MASKFEITLEAKEFVDFLKDVPRQYSDQILGDMAHKAASVVRRQARKDMPTDGELGQVGKKAVIIARNRANKTERILTIGGGYVTYKGKQISVGKIIRHMSAGKQNLRKTRRGYVRGKVKFRGGDFIERAFQARRAEALRVMTDDFGKILRRRAARVRGLSYAG